MRNVIRVSDDFGLHYITTTCTSTVSTTESNNSETGISFNNEFDHGFGVGLEIPLDSIDDIFWATDDLAGWFFDPKADVFGYFDDFDDNGNLIAGDRVPEEKMGACPAPTVVRVKDSDTSVNKIYVCKPADDHKSRGNNKEANNMIKKSVGRPLDKAVFEPKPTSTKRKIIEDAYDKKAKQPKTIKDAEYILTPAQDTSIIEKSVCKKSDEDQKSRGRKTEANNMKKSVVPLDKAAFEQKLSATKRKIRDAYEEKAKNRRAIKVVEFLPPPSKPTAPQTKKGPTCHKKDAFLGMKKDFFVRPKKRPKMVSLSLLIN